MSLRGLPSVLCECESSTDVIWGYFYSCKLGIKTALVLLIITLYLITSSKNIKVGKNDKKKITSVVLVLPKEFQLVGAFVVCLDSFYFEGLIQFTCIRVKDSFLQGLN